MNKTEKLLRSLLLSPSSIKSFENCHAGYLFSKVIFPRIETAKTANITTIGKKFHALAEHAFNEHVVSETLAYEKEQTLIEMKEFQSLLEERDYYGFPSVNEEKLNVDIAGLGKLEGIPDRIVQMPQGWYRIVDYKTSAYTNVDVDRRQVMSYAYLLWKVKGFDPGKLEITIDYIRANEVFTYKLSKSDLEMHENYLKSRFRLIRKVLADFARHYDITRITHSPGDCQLCPMTGQCVVYQAWLHPRCNPVEPEELSTMDLVREKIDRQEQGAINEERLQLINRTLMFRYKHSQPEPGDQENRSFRDIIEEHMYRVQQYMEDYDAQAVLEHLVPLRAKQMLRGVPFSELVDMSVLTSIVTEIICEYIPKRIKASSIPADVLKKIADYKERRPKQPYLRLKS